MAYSPEMARPNEHRNPPQVREVAPADDIRTIMLNQVSWGAVFAGATIALVMQITQHGWSRRRAFDHRRSRRRYADCRIPLHRGRYLVGYLRNSCGCGWWLHRWAAFRKGISIDNRLSWFDCVGGFDPIVVYLLSTAASGLIGGAVSTASSALGGPAKPSAGPFKLRPRPQRLL